MSTVHSGFDSQSDAELINSVRAGTLAAYGTLYQRHVGAAHNLARQLVRSAAVSDDLVSEAFAKVLDTLRAGKGPDNAFRAYLLTTLRHTAYDKTRKDKRVDLNEDMSTVGGEALTVPFSDPAVAGLERTLAAKAFARLPERWQTVLWHTEIERQTPAEVAPLLGLTANGVSALAYRAREGLRQAYLQEHLAQASAQRCRATAERLGAWTRDGLSKRERAQVETHLDECDQCRALAAELADVNGALRAVVAPIVLGGAALGYLATSGAKAAGVAATAASGSAAAGAAAAGPRQFAGVALSGIAIAAAVAVALAAGGGQTIPQAVQQPSQVAPTPDLPQPAVPPPPPPSAIQPVPTPQPAPPKLIALGTPSAIELQPGGGPVQLPITIRNDGGTTSGPVTVTLSLPGGVSAVGGGGGGGATTNSGASGADGGQTQTSPMVDCPAGQGTVTCGTAQGLRPGETAVLTFRLAAAPGAKGGRVTGTINAGEEIRLPITVDVSVGQAPDALHLDVDAYAGLPLPLPQPVWVDVDVRNDGPSTKPVTVTISKPAQLIFGHFRATCASASGGISCSSMSALAPGDHLTLSFELDHSADDGPVTVSATLGSATVTKSVSFDPASSPAPTPSPGTTRPAAPTGSSGPATTPATTDPTTTPSSNVARTASGTPTPA